MPDIPTRPSFPSFNDPNTGIDPAVINVAITPPIVDILNPNGSSSVCTPADFSPLYSGGTKQGTVTLFNTAEKPPVAVSINASVAAASSSIVVKGDSWIDFVFDHTWNEANPGDLHDWRPIGIVFNGTKGGRGDNNVPMVDIAIFPAGLVRDNAPPRSGSTLRIHDTCNITTGAVNYCLLVQYSNNQVAMIDPSIVNETED